MSFNDFPRKMTLICTQQSPFAVIFWPANSLVERTDLADHLEHFIRFESFFGFIFSIRQSDVERKTILCKAVLSGDAAEAASSGGGRKVNSCPTKVNLYTAELIFVIFEKKRKSSALWVTRNCNKVFLTIVMLGVR